MKKKNYKPKTPYFILGIILTVSIISGCNADVNSSIEKEFNTSEYLEIITSDDGLIAELNTTDASEEKTKAIEESSAAEEKYIFSDIADTIMYVTVNTNINNLDGSSLDMVSENQAVTVNGKCNEKGWYRIKWKDSDAYINCIYLSDSKIETGAEIKKENKPIDNNATQPQTQNQTQAQNQTQSSQTYFDRAAAEEVWALVNAERKAAGLSEIVWDENVYNFACKRAMELQKDFSHNGCENYGENIYYASWSRTGAEVHNAWYKSSKHHENYLYPFYNKGACAIYHASNGYTYATENFIADFSNNH